MYNNGALASTGIASVGLAMNAMWMFLAAFAVLAALLALGRILPRGE